MGSGHQRDQRQESHFGDTEFSTILNGYDSKSQRELEYLIWRCQESGHSHYINHTVITDLCSLTLRWIIALQPAAVKWLKFKLWEGFAKLRARARKISTLLISIFWRLNKFQWTLVSWIVCAERYDFSHTQEVGIVNRNDRRGEVCLVRAGSILPYACE